MAWHDDSPDLSTFTLKSRGMSFPPGAGLPGRVWVSKQPVWVRDLAEDPGFLRAPLARESGLRSGVGIPIQTGEDVIAVITFFFREAADEEKRLVDLVSLAGRLLGSLIQAKMDESRARYEHRMDASCQLCGGVAHHFNNILTIVIGYGNLIQRNLREDDPVRKDADQILAASWRAVALIKDLLAYCRKQSFDPKPISLNQVVNRAKESVERLFRAQIELETRLADEDLVVHADLSHMRRVLVDLTTNAVDAMPFGGKIVITTSLRPDRQPVHQGARLRPLWRIRPRHLFGLGDRHGRRRSEKGVRAPSFHKGAGKRNRHGALDRLRDRQTARRVRRPLKPARRGNDGQHLSPPWPARPEKGVLNPSSFLYNPRMAELSPITIIGGGTGGL